MGLLGDMGLMNDTGLASLSGGNHKQFSLCCSLWSSLTPGKTGGSWPALLQRPGCSRALS